VAIIKNNKHQDVLMRKRQILCGVKTLQSATCTSFASEDHLYFSIKCIFANGHEREKPSFYFGYLWEGEGILISTPLHPLVFKNSNSSNHLSSTFLIGNISV
jgi:hypothetical protein